MALRKMELAKAKHYLEEVLAHRWACPCCWSPPCFLRVACCFVLLVSAIPSRRTLERTYHAVPMQCCQTLPAL